MSEDFNQAMAISSIFFAGMAGGYAGAISKIYPKIILATLSITGLFLGVINLDL
jgi:hypothetical protein